MKEKRKDIDTLARPCLMREKRENIAAFARPCLMKEKRENIEARTHPRPSLVEETKSWGLRKT